MTTENVATEQRDSAREVYGSVAGNRWIQLSVRCHRDDRHLQLSICLHALYAGHETDIHGSALREDSGHILGFYSV